MNRKCEHAEMTINRPSSLCTSTQDAAVLYIGNVYIVLEDEHVFHKQRDVLKYRSINSKANKQTK